MQTTEQQANEILTKGVLMYDFKGKKPFTQYYQIDFNKPCLVGGLKEQGYQLKHFKDGSKSSTVITYLDALRVASGKKIKQHLCEVTFKKLN